MDELQALLDNDNSFLASYIMSINDSQATVDDRDPAEIDDYYDVENDDDTEELSSIYDDNYQYGLDDEFDPFAEDEQSDFENEDSEDDSSFLLNYLLGDSAPPDIDIASGFAGPGKEVPSNVGKSVKDAIVANESGGRYDVVNPGSTATGKYQFIWSIWKNKIGAVTGAKTRQEFLNNPEAQDQFYDWYEKNEMAPAVSRLQQYNSQGYTPTQLGRLFHYRGEAGARAYLQGRVPDKPEANNPSISQYLAKYKQAGGPAPLKKKFQAGGNTLPVVEVTAKMPKWQKYSLAFDKLLPKSEAIQQYLDPLARALGNSETVYPERIDKKYDAYKRDYIARGLILDRNDNNYTDKEKEIINSSRYKGMSKKDVYENPVHFDITTDNRYMNSLYDNSNLIDFPGSRQAIQKLARRYISNADAIGGAVTEDNFFDKLRETDEQDDVFFNPVSQFLLKDQNLDTARYKPANDYYEFLPSYSIKSKAGINKNINEFLKKYANQQTLDSIRKSPIFINDDNIQNPPVYQEDTNLGKYKSGVAYDTQRNLPYYFVSDAWDFEPQSYSNAYVMGNPSEGQTPQNVRKSYQQAYLLQKAGNPFKVYDRFYFNPQTGEYIPDDQVNKKQAGGVPIAHTAYDQYIGLNDDSLQELLLPLEGQNIIRGLDSGEPVEILDSKGKRKVLRGPKDQTIATGKVYEKRLTKRK